MTAQHDAPHVDAAIDGLERQFVQFFARTKSLWKQAAASIDPDLAPIGYKLLTAIHRDGPIHAGALAADAETDKSVVSRQLRFLEERGLVTSAPDPEDGRSKFYATTPDADARLEARRAQQRIRRYGWLASWPEERVVLLTELLGELNEGLRELTEPVADAEPGTEPRADRDERSTPEPAATATD